MNITISLSCTNCDATEIEEIDDEGRFGAFSPEWISDSMLCDSCQ